MRKIIVDLEMTGLSMNDKPISLAALDIETGKVFYAEFTDWSIFDICKSNRDWMKENVIDNLISNLNMRVQSKSNSLTHEDLLNKFDSSMHINLDRFKGGFTAKDKNSLMVVGNTDIIRTEFKTWLNYIRGDEFILFNMDVGHYDFVFLCQLFGGAFGLPNFISPVYEDLNYHIANIYDVDIHTAFDISREQLLVHENIDLTKILHKYNILKSKSKHNALVDVLVNYEIYKLKP